MGPQLDIDSIEARTVQVGVIAQLIRRIDGEHSMGAGALAEALFDHGVRVGAAVTPTPQAAVEPCSLTYAHEAHNWGHWCAGTFPVTSTPEAATDGDENWTHEMDPWPDLDAVTPTELRRATEQQCEYVGCQHPMHFEAELQRAPEEQRE